MGTEFSFWQKTASSYSSMVTILIGPQFPVEFPKGQSLAHCFFYCIPLSVDSSILLFADNAKIFRSIRSEAEYLQLQKDIDIYCTNGLKLGCLDLILVSAVLHLGHTHSYGNYYMDGNVIASVESVKGLGIVVDSSLSLKFHNHTAMVTARANHILAMINKSYEYLNNNMLPQLYKSFVLPILEYGNIVWGPQFILDKQSAEKIQRATRLVRGLEDLQTNSLRYQHHRGDLIYTYRLSHNMLDMESSSLFIQQTTYITRGHDFKIYKPHAVCLPCRHFFCN